MSCRVTISKGMGSLSSKIGSYINWIFMSVNLGVIMLFKEYFREISLLIKKNSISLGRDQCLMINFLMI